MSGQNKHHVRNSPELAAMGLRERAEMALSQNRQVDEASGCWLWAGCKMPTGHGQLRIKNKPYLAHRLAAWLWLGLDIENRIKGSRKDRSQVNHKCANANCFNPEHLYVGTQRENRQPAECRPRQPQTHCDKGHAFTAETYRKGHGCLICEKAYRDQWRREHHDLIMARQRENRALQKVARVRRVA